MDPDNPPHGRSGLPVHEEQVAAALNQRDQAEAQGPQPPFSQVAHSTAGQAAPFHPAQYASWQEELQAPYQQPNTAQALPFYHAQAAPFHHAQYAPVHYGYAAPSQEQPQVPHPPIAQVAQPAFAPVALLHDQAVLGEPALAQPQVPQPGAFAQAARQKENRQANAAELANDPLSRNKLPWDEDEDEYLCRIFLEEVSVDKMSKLMYRSNTSITQRKKNLKKDGKWDKLEAAIVQAES